MTKHGKKYTDAARRFDREQLHDPAEALELVKSLASRKFDETVEAAFRLGVDPRKADQMLRGTVSLPEGQRQDACASSVFAAGRRGPRRRGGRRGHRRRRGPRRPGRGRVPRLRRRDRDARTSWARSASSAGRSARAA